MMAHIEQHGSKEDSDIGVRDWLKHDPLFAYRKEYWGNLEDDVHAAVIDSSSVEALEEWYVKASPLANLFREHVEIWKEDTALLSSVTRMILHPSYLRIIGLARKSDGLEIERLLLQELKAEPDHWFAALSAVTGENPVGSNANFEESVDAWLKWGESKGII